MKAGAKEIILLAAGHNQKVPLLLICTAFTMLKGKTHNKTWKVNEADGSESHSTRLRLLSQSAMRYTGSG